MSGYWERIMTPVEIAVLVASGESESLKFKSTTGTRREVAMTVCAFLNQNGGQVLFGVTGGWGRGLVSRSASAPSRS